MPQSSVMSAIVILDRGFWAQQFFQRRGQGPLWSVWTPSPLLSRVQYTTWHASIKYYFLTVPPKEEAPCLSCLPSKQSAFLFPEHRASFPVDTPFQTARRISHRCLPRNPCEHGFPLLTLLEVLWPTAEVVCPPSCTGTIFAKTTPALPLWRTSLSSPWP